MNILESVLRLFNTKKSISVMNNNSINCNYCGSHKIENALNHINNIQKIFNEEQIGGYCQDTLNDIKNRLINSEYGEQLSDGKITRLSIATLVIHMTRALDEWGYGGEELLDKELDLLYKEVKYINGNYEIINH